MVPRRSNRTTPPERCSPRTRGWSRPSGCQQSAPLVLPAHAGMVPPIPLQQGHYVRAPRARGDGPLDHVLLQLPVECSPRTRGWSRPGAAGRVVLVVLPAHAGMVPGRWRTPAGLHRAPRARGDGPWVIKRPGPGSGCSPRTRGWSHRVPPGSFLTLVLPAHAGMVPTAPICAMPRSSAPRARGDGPPRRSSSDRGTTCSPRTRGWSPGTELPHLTWLVLPAHAGMVPADPVQRARIQGAPRARGDGPHVQPLTHVTAECSPRTRGWSRRLRRSRSGSIVLPAHAGMVPVK